MIITTHKTIDQQAVEHNDDSDMHKDEIGENSGEDTGLTKAFKQDEGKKKDTSNTQKGPANENL